MVAIQITVDRDLLSALDADEQVQRLGRSAVFRGLAREYLRRRRERRIAEDYRRAYGGDGGDDPEWTGWEDEAAWPEELHEAEAPECPGA